MMRRFDRNHVPRFAGAAVLTVTLLGVGASAAGASQTYQEAIQLSWDGSNYAAAATESFVGAPVTVPGDHATRSLLVRNDGPTDGVLRAAITNVELLDPDSADVHRNPNHQAPDESGNYAGAGDQGNFYDDLTIAWGSGQASMTELDSNETTQILELDLDQGEETQLTVDYEFPYQATSGNAANVDPRLASFDVTLTLGGELPADPTPTPTPTEPAVTPELTTPEPTAPASPAPESSESGELAVTGANTLWLALLGAGLVSLGVWITRASRNRSMKGRA